MSVKANVLASWTCHVVVMVIGFFLMPYVIHTIGDQPYGTWIFLNAIAGYSGLLYLGFGETISRYVSQHYARQEWERLNEVVSGIFAAYFVSGAMALMAAAVFAAIAPWVCDWEGQSVREIQAAILTLGLSAAVSIMGSVNGGVLYGTQRFDLERGILIAGMVAKLGLILFLLSSQFSLICLAMIFLVHTTLEQVLYFVAARRIVPTLRIGLRGLKWSALKESYGFAAMSGVGLVASKLIYGTDFIVIGLAIGNAAIVPYAIGSRLCEMIRQPIMQIGEVFLPRASELHAHADHDVLRILVCRGMGIAFLLAAGLFIGGSYFGSMLINVWMGAGYSQSQLIFLVLIGAQVAAAPSGILHMVLVGIGDVQVPSLIRLSQAILNLVLSLILVKPFGIFGVALGTMIPILIIDLGVLLPYGIRRLQMTPGYFLKHSLGPHLVPLSALWAYSYVVSTFSLDATWPTILAVTGGGGVVLALTSAGVWLASQHGSMNLTLLPSTKQSEISGPTDFMETVCE